MVDLASNNALERTVMHRGRLTSARSSWPAAQLGRYTVHVLDLYF